MGLPQYLKRKLNAMKEDEGGAYTDLQWVIYFAGKEGVRAHERTPLIDIIKSGLKLQYGYTKPDRSYSLEKEPQPLDLVSTTRFIGVWKAKDGTEPPRVCRRPDFLRGYRYGQSKQVFSRSAGAGGAAGRGASG